MANIFGQIWQMEDLRKRVLFTLGLLGVYRMGIFVPTPGIDRTQLKQWLDQQQSGMLGLYNMFTGGAFEQFSIFTLGIMPYISSSIIMQLLTQMVPQLERIQKEGQQGKNRITQYTRYLTIVIAVFQGLSMAFLVEQMRLGSSTIVIEPGWPFRIMTILTVTAGSCFVMWLGEQISERGIGNGSSIIIATGILANVPRQGFNLARLVQGGEMTLLAATLLLAGMFVVISSIVFMERGQRRIPIQYAKRVLGRRVYEGQTAHLPLKINNAGVVPPIFASTLIMGVQFLIGKTGNNAVSGWLTNALHQGYWLYNLVFAGMIVFFSFFYTAVTFNPVDVAENLKKQGGYIPRIRPGSETAEYINRLLQRLTTAGSVYLAALCIMPPVLSAAAKTPFQFGGTGLLILVGVSLDTVAQIEAHLMTRHYDGLVGPKGGKIKGRRRLMTAGGGAEL